MEHNDKAVEQALDEALGKAKYYVDAEGKKEGERYFWFPTEGNSMTDNTHRSIPAGSLVLGRLLPVITVRDIPLNQPIVVIINDNGRQYCMLKSVCRITTNDAPDTNNGSEEFCLRSYNPRYDDFWLPFYCVKFIFVVERVRRPDGSEFVPQQEDIVPGR
jgi:hypothetical protein